MLTTLNRYNLKEIFYCNHYLMGKTMKIFLVRHLDDETAAQEEMKEEGTVGVATVVEKGVVTVVEVMVVEMEVEMEVAVMVAATAEVMVEMEAVVAVEVLEVEMAQEV